jgi:hypothetical protein
VAFSGEWEALHVVAANECIKRGAPAKAIPHLRTAGRSRRVCLLVTGPSW